MRYASKIALALAAGVSALAIISPVLAQESPAPDGAGLDEIVVTAQKREQNLQDVPVAISAISQAKIEQLDIRDARDISGLAPSVSIAQPTTSMTAGVISIRGIPSGAQESLSLDQANGLYLDGVYIARSGAAALDVTDLARVEVLRGPQGTLFGRNTTGGAISFVSREPSETFKASIRAGIGNYGLWTARASIDPGEILGIRSTFSYSHSQHHGYVDNILQPDSQRDPGARESDSFRAAFKADLGGTGSIRYIFDYSNTRGYSNSFQLLDAATGAPRPPVSVDGRSVPLMAQAPVAGYLSQVTFLEPGCAAFSTPSRQYRDQTCLNSDAGARDQNWGHNLQIQNDFGAFKFKATTGYRIWHSDNNGSDLDGLGTIRGPLFTSATLLNGLPASLLSFIPTIPAAAVPFVAGSPVPTTTQDLFTTTDYRKHRQLSQEIEISGNSTNLDWVVGGFYFWEKGSEYNPQNSAFILDTNQLFLANFGALGPSLAAANPARYRAVVTNGIVNYEASAESKAMYGQATYYFGGRDAPFSLTGGLRYTWDNKSITRFQNGATPSAVPEIGRADFQRLTWNVMARYAFDRDISVYARAASGYRSGGFNPADAPPLTAFQPETVTSYELGLKSELFDRHLRLNIAGYYNKYNNLAVITPIPSGTTFNTKIVNAGRVNFYGFEVEGQAILSDNFSIDGSFGFVDVKYKEVNVFATTLPGSPAINAGSISHPTYTSKYTANIALNAQFPLGNGGAKILARVGYTYLSPQYSFINVLAAPFNEEIRSDAQHQVDAQLTLDKIGIGGMDAELRIWAKNLTDEHSLVRSVDFGQLGFAGGYFNNPRTFGATVGFNF